MTSRAEFLAHLDALCEAGHPPTCWTVPIPDRACWTSENPSERALAARLCRGCPALTPCAAYGLAHPDEAGVIGGLSEAQRTRTKEETA